MGAKNGKEKNFENSSVTPVFEKSLNSNKNNSKIILKKQIEDDITNELKEEVILPREDEYYDSSEIIFENKQELKIKDFFDNFGEENSDPNLNRFYPDDIFNCKRSKSFVPKPVILKAPTLKPNPLDNIFYPFRLSMKSYGMVPKWNEKPNKILFDYQKEHMDYKSCNDKIEFSDDYLLYTETEKTTPNLEDLQDLLSFRQKMSNFRSTINDSTYNEYESILSCEDIIEDIQEVKKKKRHKSKKKSDWNRYVKYMLKKERHRSLTKYKNRKSEPFPDFSNKFYKNGSSKDTSIEEDEKKEEEDKDKDDNEEGFSILGMIERVSKERKRTKSVVVN